MKRVVVFWLCLAMVLFGSMVCADDLILIDSIPGPDTKIEDMALDTDGSLWMIFNEAAQLYKGMIVKTDMSGKILTSFVAPGEINSYYESPTPRGLAYDGTYLWCINRADKTIYKITTSGEIISSFAAPGSYCYDLAWDGENLWLLNTDNNKIYKINPSSGDILHTINSPGWEEDTDADALAYNGEYLWISNDYGKKIYRINPESGDIVTEYGNIFNSGTANALVWDGQYLLAGGSDGSAVRKYEVRQPPDYPNPTMEQVNLLPDGFEGMTVYFDNASFSSSLSKKTSFTDTIYMMSIWSKDDTLYSGGLSEDRINFYVSKRFATDIIFADLKESYYDANLTCIIEKKTTSDGNKTYWMCQIIKIVLFDDEYKTLHTLEETGITPPNPVEEAVLTERSKWDANGDNKIGLEEAIRALQVIAGIR